jgi:hypothetical protein
MLLNVPGTQVALTLSHVASLGQSEQNLLAMTGPGMVAPDPVKYLPMSHNLHSSEDVRPKAVRYDPSLQVVHSLPPASEYVPTGHMPPIDMVLLQYEPAGHFKHRQLSRYWPYGHDVLHGLAGQ